MKETSQQHPPVPAVINTAVRIAIGSVLALLPLLSLAASRGVATKRPPNMVLIVADDMGFSDLGSYGGEIKTPNLDRLAQRGIRFTDFHTGPTCSPSRSMLLTGTDNHIAGLGNMDEALAPNQLGKPGYEGYLNHSVVTVAELLHDNGYHTYWTGKWHLGKKPDQIPGSRGFERSFGLLDGDGSYFDDTGMMAGTPKGLYSEDGKYLTKLPKGFYATKTYTDKMIDYIESGRHDGKPFFAYLAHQAPHEPYGLPDEKWLRKYAGKYDAGWDTLRKQRLARMKEMGIVPEDAHLADRLWFIPPSDVLAPVARAIVGRKMELYASVVENMDYHIGRLIDYLKQIGEYDNTVFIFLSDNGAEGNDKESMIVGARGTNDFLFYARKWSNNDPNSWGRPGAQCTYGPGWAQVSMTPFRGFKGWASEGTIRLPLIVSGAGVTAQPGSINRSLLHIMDLTPTMLELAGVSHPDTYQGQPVAPMQGKSLVPLLTGQAQAVRGPDDWLGWEMFGNRTVRQGDWTIVWEWKPIGKEDWELFNLGRDIAQQEDLAAKKPEKLKQMVALWDEYATANNIVLPSRTTFEDLEDKLPERVPVDEGFPRLIFKKQFVPPKELLVDPKPVTKTPSGRGAAQ